MSATIPPTLQTWLLAQGWEKHVVKQMPLRPAQTIQCDLGNGVFSAHVMPAQRLVAVHPDAVVIAGENGAGQPYEQAYPRDAGQPARTLWGVRHAIPFDAWQEGVEAGTLVWAPYVSFREIPTAPPPPPILLLEPPQPPRIEDPPSPAAEASTEDPSAPPLVEPVVVELLIDVALPAIRAPQAEEPESAAVAVSPAVSSAAESSPKPARRKTNPNQGSLF